MAYVTVSGVRALLDTFNGHPPRRSSWLIGLDDAVTQPGAIRLLLKLPGATVKLATLASSARRFHPKVVLLKRERPSPAALLMVGSANLTAAALAENAEAVTFLKARTAGERATLNETFGQLWQIGMAASPARIAEYETRYRRAERVRRILRKVTGENTRTRSEILKNDSADLDPSMATICWIECGYVTALGRELEIKAEQGLFFGLPPSGSDPSWFDFEVSDGTIASLRMKYQANKMWRLQLTPEVPEFVVGLRPRLANGKLGRSPYVAVIEKTGQASPRFRLRFIEVGGQEVAQLVQRSRRSGTYGQTSARQFGWCT